MIRNVFIQRLRGIRHGELTELAPLTILVGRNGSGKTTILDALLVAGSRSIVDGMARAIKRRAELSTAARWLLWRTGDEGAATVTLEADGKRRRSVTIGATGRREHCLISWSIKVEGGASSPSGHANFGPNGFVGGGESGGLSAEDEPPDLRLVEFQPSGHEPLHILYSEAARLGRRGEVKQLVADVVPGVEDLQILTEGDQPVVQLLFKSGSVPVALAGDGILSLVILSLEMAVRPGGTVMLEEPEVYQHPAAMRQTAKAILAAVRRDVQVILSTHSLDLIDHLIAESSARDLDSTALFRLALHDGVLKSTRIPGPDIAFARGQIGDDLR